MTQAKAASGYYITFRLGNELFAIDVGKVREVLDFTQITKVPTSPPYMRGVVNVRGSAIPVVDLRIKFGLPPAPDTVNTRIVVLDLSVDGEATIVGGLADSVHDVIEIDARDIGDPPRIATRWRPELIAGMAKKGEQFITIWDIERVFASDGAALAAGALDPSSAAQPGA